MNKKIILYVMGLCLFCNSSNSYAKCPEDSIVEKAKQEYSDFVSEIYDSAIGDPSDSRSLAACLGSIEDIGSIFSMGVSLPSMDSIIEQACNAADSYLQDAINEAKGKINEVKNEVTDNAIFSVVLDPNSVADKLINNLKP